MLGIFLSAIIEDVKRPKPNLAFIKVRTQDAFYDLTVFSKDVSTLVLGQTYIIGLRKPELYNNKISYVVTDFELAEGGE